MSEECKKTVEAIDIVEVSKKDSIPFDIFFNSLIKMNPKIKEWHKRPIKVFCESFVKEATMEEWLNIIKQY